MGPSTPGYRTCGPPAWESEYVCVFEGVCVCERERLRLVTFHANIPHTHLSLSLSLSLSLPLPPRPPPEEYASAGQHIESLVDIIAFSVRDHLVDIEEFFFSLPKVNRQALEYLLVCLAKLDVLSRRAKNTAQPQPQQQQHDPLQSM